MDFRKKLLALAVTTLGVAGGASAAVQYPCGAGDTGSSNVTGLPNILRTEGTNDLVTDLAVNCLSGSTLTTGDVVVTLNANVTSTQVSRTLNEATLNIYGTDGTLINSYPGVVSANQVTFGGTAGVTFPTDTAFTIMVQNIRVNSSALTSGTYVTEILNIYNEGVVAYSTSQTTPAVTNGGVPINVGYVQQGFALPSLVAFSVTPFTLCQAQTDDLAFSLTISEKFGGAFKTNNPNVDTLSGLAITCGGVSCTSTNGEEGTYPEQGANGFVGSQPGAAPAVGAANSGTRFIFSFSNIPSGVSVLMPLDIVSGTVEMALTSSATGPFLQPTATPFTAPAAAALTISNGTATAVYEVVATDNTVPSETINIPGYVTFAANFATSAVGPITVTVNPGPTGSTNVPNFAPQNNPSINLNSWTPCQTTLLFPFVTNQLGFDTGIVLANTSTDPGGAPPLGNGASPSAGTCALSFYGSGAPTNPVAAPGGSQASGTTNAFQLSQVAPGFQGYMFAVCNYLYGHGYAFVEFDLTNANGIAEGYLPLVVTDRDGGTKALNEELNN